jgi:cytochrome c heme-lyase
MTMPRGRDDVDVNGGSGTGDDGNSVGKCPIDHRNGGTGVGPVSSLWKVFEGRGKSDNGNVVETEENSNKIQPVQDVNAVASLEEAAKHAQTPHPQQRLPLSTHRSYSSIPRGHGNGDGVGDSDVNVPHHQIVVNTIKPINSSPDTTTNSKWVYPSEQQVFNAMKRKGWDGIEEESIPSFLQIHNSVNERSWRLLCDWEQTNVTRSTSSGNDGSSNNESEIKLVRFEGRPTDISPKAWVLSTLGLQPRPFDRHDWYIDNGTQHSKRYVLDFYMRDDGSNSSTSLPRVDIDVRPALDTPQAFVQRGQRIFKELFPGIAKELESLSSSSSWTASGSGSRREQQ